MYPNNPNDIHSNFVVYTNDKTWELYLHEDMNQFIKPISKCLAVTDTLSQMLMYLENKIDGLRGVDIFVNQIITVNSEFENLIYWVVEQPDGLYCLFEDFGSKGRQLIDEDSDIDSLVLRNHDKNINLSF